MRCIVPAFFLWRIFGGEKIDYDYEHEILTADC